MGATRAILHVDMDAFYASAEQLRRPELRGRPVIVGGSGERGVVAAASYEARAYGIRSAMPSVQAMRLCPHATVLAPDHAYYATVSRRVHDVFEEFTPIIEPLALDEAFLDVTAARRRLGDEHTIGTELRRRVRLRVDLGCSVGVATSKLVAKLACEAAKPSPSVEGPVPGRGIVVVAPGSERAFLGPHPVEALWGVGPATLRKLSALGIRTIEDLAAVPRAAVVASLGVRNGEHLHALALAIDDRPVETDRELKSIGHEETFAHDHHDHDTLDPLLVAMVEAVTARLRRHDRTCRTVQIKVRFADFTTVTRSVTPGSPLDTVTEVLAAARSLLGTVDATPGIRLLGVSVAGLSDDTARQLTLDLTGSVPDVEPSVDRAVDAVTDRFGAAAIGRASGLDTGRRALPAKPSG